MVLFCSSSFSFRGAQSQGLQEHLRRNLLATVTNKKPTSKPTSKPTAPTAKPTAKPSFRPTLAPTAAASPPVPPSPFVNLTVNPNGI
jgi:hypothetical protein